MATSRRKSIKNAVKRAIKKRVSPTRLDRWEERLRPIFRPGSQSGKAARYWAGLTDYEESYYTSPDGLIRSQWIADQIEPLGIGSMLEVGTNSGRNLAIALEHFPDLKLRGIDVNKKAIRFAKKKNPGIDFEVVDANRWNEPDKSTDAIITMSLIDHIPDESMRPLAKNMVRTARKYVICVELWDGSEGWRGKYKYSRDLRKVFEPLGVKTLRWEKSVGQYNEALSPLYVYVGAVPGAEEHTAPAPERKKKASRPSP